MSTDAVEAPSPTPPPGRLPDPLEASLAPREGELLSLPFDQYGRMRIAQNLILALYSEIAQQIVQPDSNQLTLQVLDVGGYPGILRHFLSGGAYEVSVVDVVPDDGTIPGYRQGSGMELPYADQGFDVVTSLDTLEHIPAEHRDKFLSELKRVARYAVVLINPVQSIQADLAEETLDDYIRWILDAQQEQLAEHRMYGLPDFDGTVAAFEREGWQTTRFPIANIHNWLLMMVAKHYLISMRDERASAFERTLDRFYNLSFSETDRTEPAYRGVMVAVRPGLEGALRRVEELYPPLPTSDIDNTQRLQLAQLLMTMLDLKVANHEDRLLREQMERRDRHISGLENRVNMLEDQKADLDNKLNSQREKYGDEFTKHEKYIARLEEEQKAKDEHILYLEKLLQGIEAGRVMRITRAFARFLGRK
jgi:hypothetical protein